MADAAVWVSTAEPPVLAESELHLWRASLQVSAELLERFEATLSPSEKERAQRFRVPDARERFIAGRGILRDLLGAYLRVAPEQIELRYGADGKPSLSSVHESPLCFSVSHSQNMALFAMTRGSEVGIDVEQVRAGFGGMQIASHFFSEEEVAALAQLPPESATDGFFGCWTKKEAYVKARGQGLGIPLRSFTVKFGESQQELRDENGAAWSCYALAPAGEFSGAVVVAGEGWKVRYLEWPAERDRSEARP